MGRESFLNMRARRALLEDLRASGSSPRKALPAEAGREVMGRTRSPSSEALSPEPVRRGDPDFAMVRSRRRGPTEALPIGEIEARLARPKRVRAKLSSADDAWSEPGA